MYTACTRNTEKNLISVFMVFLSLSLFSFGRKQAQAGSAGTSFQEKKKKGKKKKRKKSEEKKIEAQMAANILKTSTMKSSEIEYSWIGQPSL